MPFSGPSLVLFLICMAGLVWAIVALGKDDGESDPKRRQQWRIASVIALVFLVAMTGGLAIGQDLF